MRCVRCKIDKPKSDFNKSSRYSTGFQQHCRECSKAYYRANKSQHVANAKKRTKRYQAEVRQFLHDYLVDHPCVDCGESDILVLEFDHVRGQKTAAVSSLFAKGYPIRTIEAEIAKCEVRCANCHRRQTAERSKNWRWIIAKGE